MDEIVQESRESATAAEMGNIGPVATKRICSDMAGANLLFPGQIAPKTPKTRGRPLGSKIHKCSKQPSTAKKDRGLAKKLYQVLEQQGFKCAVSGQPLTPDNACLDYAVPVSRGGAHSIENYQWVTRDINRAKGAMLDCEFLKMCRDVIAWAENREQR